MWWIFYENTSCSDGVCSERVEDEVPFGKEG